MVNDLYLFECREVVMQFQPHVLFDLAELLSHFILVEIRILIAGNDAAAFK